MVFFWVFSIAWGDVGLCSSTSNHLNQTTRLKGLWNFDAFFNSQLFFLPAPLLRDYILDVLFPLEMKDNVIFGFLVVVFILLTSNWKEWMSLYVFQSFFFKKMMVMIQSDSSFERDYDKRNSDIFFIEGRSFSFITIYFLTVAIEIVS